MVRLRPGRQSIPFHPAGSRLRQVRFLTPRFRYAAGMEEVQVRASAVANPKRFRLRLWRWNPPRDLDLSPGPGQSGAVNVVAIHYAPGRGEALVPVLAEATDKTLYEARARLSSPEGGPAVVANFGEIEPAWAFAGRLRANGDPSPSC